MSRPFLNMRPGFLPAGKVRHLANCRDCGLMFESGQPLEFGVRMRCPGCVRLMRNDLPQKGADGAKVYENERGAGV